jgi:hypothetical protein
VGLERGPLSLMKITDLNEKVARLRYKNPRLMTVGIGCADQATLSNRKSWHKFADKRLPIGRYSSSED